MEKTTNETDFQKAGEWFISLPYDKMVAICTEANSKTPHSINDKDLVLMWKKYSEDLQIYEAIQDDY